MGTPADIRERMNKQTSGSGDGVSLSMGTVLGNMEGAPLPGTLRERLIFRRWGADGSVDGSLRRGPVGEPGEGIRLEGTVRDSGRRAPEMEHLSLRELC